MMNNGTGKEALMRRITEVSFAIDELRLFLDTHPDCAEALGAINDRIGIRDDLIRRYSEKYCGIEAYYPDCGEWEWNTAPMPWKKEANY